MSPWLDTLTAWLGAPSSRDWSSAWMRNGPSSATSPCSLAAGQPLGVQSAAGRAPIATDLPRSGDHGHHQR